MSIAGSRGGQHRVQERRILLPDPPAGERAEVTQPLAHARPEDCARRPVRLRQVDLRPAPSKILQSSFRRNGQLIFDHVL